VYHWWYVYYSLRNPGIEHAVLIVGKTAKNMWLVCVFEIENGSLEYKVEGCGVDSSGSG
jgi:hypothetical protein